jgi:uncharacterized membrane protein YhaH (DUF805 family)
MSKSPNFVSIAAFLSIFGFLYFTTLQVLSLFHAITQFTVILNVLVASGITSLWISKIRNELGVFAKSLSSDRHPSSKLIVPRKKHLRFSKYFTGFGYVLILLDLCVILFLCIYMPPNNYDSMTYHLPRMEAWYQSGSLWGLSSYVDRQIWNPQFAETLLLIIKAISQNDNLLNIVQLIALLLILAIFYSWSVSRKQSNLFRILGLITLLSWPTLLLEATTTKNDIVAALYCLTASIFLILCNSNSRTWTPHLLFAMSIGICIATKGTSELFAFVALLIYSFIFVRKRFSLLKWVFTVTVPTLLNLPLWIQNFVLYNSIFSPKVIEGNNVLVSNPSPVTFIENFSRVVFMNFALPSDSWNESLTRFLEKGLGLFGLTTNRASNTWSGEFRIFMGAHEDIASSVSIVFVLFLTIYFVLKNNQTIRRNHDIQLPMFLSFVFFFLTILLIRNQPWINRLLIPVYVLMFFALFIYLGEEIVKNNKLLIGFSSILFIYGSTFLLFATDKPLLGYYSFFSKSVNQSIFKMSEERRLFLNKPDQASRYTFELQRITQNESNQIYIYGGRDSWEYPVWRFFHDSRIKPKIFTYSPLMDVPKKSAIICLDVLDCPDGNSSFTSHDIQSSPGATPRNIFELRKTYFLNDENPIDSGTGWSYPEKWGTWSDGEFASFPFVISGSDIPSIMKVNLQLRPYLSTNGLPLQVSVEINGEGLEDFTFTKNELHEIELEYTSDLYFRTNTLPTLSFKIMNSSSPGSSGVSDDLRKLGVGLVSISFEP